MSAIVTGPYVPVWNALTGNTTTTVFDPGAQSVTLASIRVSYNNSGTPTVDLTVYDGTTRRYLAKGATVLATGLVIDGPIPLERKQVVEAKSSDASGQLDVLVSYIPSATGGRPGQS